VAGNTPNLATDQREDNPYSTSYRQRPPTSNPNNSITMAVKIIPWLLMPISNVASWYLFVSAAPGNALLQRVWKVAAFYTVWALYNRYLGGRAQELGHFSMGLMALAAFLNRKYPSMAACGLVILNFAVVIPIVLSNGPKGLAKLLYNDTSPLTMAWAYTFVSYLLSNVCLWSYLMYRLYVDVVVLAASSHSGPTPGGGSAAYEKVMEEGTL
jgi:hypothetical protein